MEDPNYTQHFPQGKSIMSSEHNKGNVHNDGNINDKGKEKNEIYLNNMKIEKGHINYEKYSIPLLHNENNICNNEMGGNTENRIYVNEPSIYNTHKHRVMGTECGNNANIVQNEECRTNGNINEQFINNNVDSKHEHNYERDEIIENDEHTSYVVYDDYKEEPYLTNSYRKNDSLIMENTNKTCSYNINNKKKTNILAYNEAYNISKCTNGITDFQKYREQINSNKKQNICRKNVFNNKMDLPLKLYETYDQQNVDGPNLGSIPIDENKIVMKNNHQKEAILNYLSQLNGYEVKENNYILKKNMNQQNFQNEEYYDEVFMPNQHLQTQEQKIISQYPSEQYNEEKYLDQNMHQGNKPIIDKNENIYKMESRTTLNPNDKKTLSKSFHFVDHITPRHYINNSQQTHSINYDKNKKHTMLQKTIEDKNFPKNYEEFSDNTHNFHSTNMVVGADHFPQKPYHIDTSNYITRNDSYNTHTVNVNNINEIYDINNVQSIQNSARYMEYNIDTPKKKFPMFNEVKNISLNKKGSRGRKSKKNAQSQFNEFVDVHHENFKNNQAMLSVMGNIEQQEDKKGNNTRGRKRGYKKKTSKNMEPEFMNNTQNIVGNNIMNNMYVTNFSNYENGNNINTMPHLTIKNNFDSMIMLQNVNEITNSNNFCPPLYYTNKKIEQNDQMLNQTRNTCLDNVLHNYNSEKNYTNIQNKELINESNNNMQKMEQVRKPTKQNLKRKYTPKDVKKRQKLIDASYANNDLELNYNDIITNENNFNNTTNEENNFFHSEFLNGKEHLKPCENSIINNIEKRYNNLKSKSMKGESFVNEKEILDMVKKMIKEEEKLKEEKKQKRNKNYNKDFYIKEMTNIVQNEFWDSNTTEKNDANKLILSKTPLMKLISFEKKRAKERNRILNYFNEDKKQVFSNHLHKTNHFSHIYVNNEKYYDTKEILAYLLPYHTFYIEKIYVEQSEDKKQEEKQQKEQYTNLLIKNIKHIKKEISKITGSFYECSNQAVIWSFNKIKEASANIRNQEKPK